MTEHEQASYYGYDCYCTRCLPFHQAAEVAAYDALTADELDRDAAAMFASAAERRAAEFAPDPWADCPF